MDESKARSMTARPDPPSPSLRRGKQGFVGQAGRPDRRRRQRRGGGRAFGAKGAGDQRQTAAERPARSARTPADGGPAGGGSAAPPQRGEHKRRGPAPHLAATDVQEGAEEGAVRRRLPLPVDTRSTVADTDFPATAEWRSLRLTGRAEGLAGRVPSESSRTSTRHEQARSERGQRLHAAGRQRRAVLGPERWHHRPRIRLRAALRRDAGGAERRERPSQEA